MKLAIPFLTAAAILITTSWSNATLQPLTDSKAADVLGGEIQGVCKPGDPGSECNKTNVVCSSGSPYCNEGAVDGSPCYYVLVFANPTTCTADPNSTLNCGTSEAIKMVCWTRGTCYCRSVLGQKFCFNSLDPADYEVHEVGKCLITGTAD